ncbi:phage Gp37/Gp68 family protein [Streptomyces caniscabiei]|uniref:phage Gp37/Gp68 family protein n=1 Tax=Streptomyces caniscabiei TaxID=2746961 RepID=UPI000A39E50D|nr:MULTISPECIES: phage Gp37/Gp68 family protein [Streptomyces]MBP5880753.1 phage Gp37/Gp68 family protein [Streptomyces sp. LBUM 1477]
MSLTRIEWATDVWNPVSGCDRVSEGCTNCYALSFARRHRAMGTRGYERDGRPETSGPGFGVSLHDWALREPLRWRTAKRVFVNSMSDAFHPEVPDEYLAALWAVMYWTGADVRGQYAHRPVQTYIILTKRPPRMRAWLRKWADRDTRVELITRAAERGWCDQEDVDNAPFMPARLASVWLGVSVEDQAAADARIPLLLETPAVVRFASVEPLLGRVDLTRWLRPAIDCGFANPDDGCCSHPGNLTPECHRWVRCPVAANGAWEGLDWVIAGGESGPKARPMHPSWVSELQLACQIAGVPLFFKQWGQWAPYGEGEATPDGVHGPVALVDQQGRTHSPKAGAPAPAGSARMARYGKKRAGNALNGAHFEQLPGHYTPQPTA